MQEKEKIKAYLQVQGVNIYASAYDTSQLSIVRGSSLLLKWAVELFDGAHVVKSNDNRPLYGIIQNYKKDSKRIATSNRLDEFELPPPDLVKPLKAITTGASSGIYEVDTDASGELAQYAEKVARFLSTHAYFRYFTFTVVWVIDPNGDFALVKERLLGKARRQQMRQISLAPQPLPNESDKKKHQPCTLQGTLPAISAMEYHPKDYKGMLSPACQYRFLLGRHLRHGLYIAETLELHESEKWNELLQQLQLDTCQAAESFDEIADGEAFGNLENKIAVFYADGNGFGKIQADIVKTVADQKVFDDKVKTYRRKFLACLVKQWMPENGKGTLRLETLLWGGDEMLFVVPASQGFALAQLFYEQSRDWHVGPEGNEKRLTHAGGLVFCHYKTPIGRAKQLAQDLAEGVKQQKYGRRGNFFDYAVLESVDYPAEPLSEFFRKRYGPLGQHRFPLQPLAAVPDQTPPPIEDDESEYPPQQNALYVDWYRQKKQIAEFLDTVPDTEASAENTLPKSQAYLLAQATGMDSLNAEIEQTERTEQSQFELLEGKELPSTAFRDKLRRFKQLQSEQGEVFKNLQALFWDGVLRPPPEPNPSFTKKEGVGSQNTFGDTSKPSLGIPRWQWLHLVELWDYLAPCPKTLYPTPNRATEETGHE